MGDWPPKAPQSSSTKNGFKKSWPLWGANFASKTRKSMQERVARSSLLLEEEDMFKKVKLTEKRAFNPEDPLENKFCLAQSQYLSVSGQYASPIESIDYVENRILMENFEMKKNEFKSAGKDVKEYLLFHGTKDKYIDSILKENFRMEYAGKHGEAYGRGIYFSEKTKIPYKYMNNQKRTLLLCRVLLGKEFLGEERDIPEGFDSKSVKPDQDQRACINIIKEVDQILPCFVLNLAPTGSPHAQPRPKFCPRAKKSLILEHPAFKHLKNQTKNQEFLNARAQVDVKGTGMEKQLIQTRFSGAARTNSGPKPKIKLSKSTQVGENLHIVALMDVGEAGMEKQQTQAENQC